MIASCPIAYLHDIVDHHRLFGLSLKLSPDMSPASSVLPSPHVSGAGPGGMFGHRIADANDKAAVRLPSAVGGFLDQER